MDFKYYTPEYDKLEPHIFVRKVIEDGRVRLNESCIFRWPELFYDIDHYPTHRLEVKQNNFGDLSLVMTMTLFDGFSTKEETSKCRDVICDVDLALEEYLQYGHDVYLSMLY